MRFTLFSTSYLAHLIAFDGRVQSYPLGNAKQGGTVRTLTYDPGSRITQMTHTGTGTGTFAPANFDQTLDYDNLDRVIGYATNAGSLSYSYDDSGNRLTTGSYLYDIDPASNRLMTTTDPSPAKNNLYDNGGNLLSDGTTTYTYSDRGLLQSSMQGGVVTQYVYNGLGQRVMKRGASDASIVQITLRPTRSPDWRIRSLRQPHSGNCLSGQHAHRRTDANHWLHYHRLGHDG
jgi:YD repeat-containing protein